MNIFILVIAVMVMSAVIISGASHFIAPVAGLIAGVCLIAAGVTFILLKVRSKSWK